MKRVYLDHGATTYLDKAVFKAMLPYWSKKFGNPSSLYFEGREAKKAIEKARVKVANILGCLPEEIYFTGSGTESDNLAIFGYVSTLTEKSELITTKIEHHAVLYPFQALAKQGHKVIYLSVNHEGLVNEDQLLKSLTKQTRFISIIYANNEIGTIQPIEVFAKTIKKYNSTIMFHTDACQAAGYLDLNVRKLGVDMLTLNGSKIYGPKGTGLLYLKKGIKLKPLMYGGGQENGLRPATENVAGIVGFAKALELAQKNKNKETLRLTKIRDYFFKEVTNRIPNVIINGHLRKRLPNNINLSFTEIEGESILLYLDRAGFSVSTGSACTSTSLKPSHVLKALGLPDEICHGSIRFTFGKKTKINDINRLLIVLPPIVKKLRLISAVKNSTL